MLAKDFFVVFAFFAVLVEATLLFGQNGLGSTSKFNLVDSSSGVIKKSSRVPPFWWNGGMFDYALNIAGTKEVAIMHTLADTFISFRVNTLDLSLVPNSRHNVSIRGLYGPLNQVVSIGNGTAWGQFYKSKQNDVLVKIDLRTGSLGQAVSLPQPVRDVRGMSTDSTGAVIYLLQQDFNTNAGYVTPFLTRSATFGSPIQVRGCSGAVFMGYSASQIIGDQLLTASNTQIVTVNVKTGQCKLSANVAKDNASNIITAFAVDAQNSNLIVELTDPGSVFPPTKKEKARWVTFHVGSGGLQKISDAKATYVDGIFAIVAV